MKVNGKKLYLFGVTMAFILLNVLLVGFLSVDTPDVLVYGSSVFCIVGALIYMDKSGEVGYREKSVGREEPVIKIVGFGFGGIVFLVSVIFFGVYIYLVMHQLNASVQVLGDMYSGRGEWLAISMGAMMFLNLPYTFIRVRLENLKEVRQFNKQSI